MLSLFRALFNVRAILHLRYAANLSRRRATSAFLLFSCLSTFLPPFCFFVVCFLLFLVARERATTNAITSEIRGARRTEEFFSPSEWRN